MRRAEANVCDHARAREVPTGECTRARKRAPRNDHAVKKPGPPVAFDPPKAVLDRTVGRRSLKDTDE